MSLEGMKQTTCEVILMISTIYWIPTVYQSILLCTLQVSSNWIFTTTLWDWYYPYFIAEKLKAQRIRFQTHVQNLLHQANVSILQIQKLKLEVKWFDQDHIARRQKLNMKVLILSVIFHWLLERWTDMEKDWSQKNSQGMLQYLKWDKNAGNKGKIREMLVCSLLTPGLSSILINGSIDSSVPSILGVREIFVLMLALPSICWVTLSTLFLFLYFSYFIF